MCKKEGERRVNQGIQTIATKPGRGNESYSKHIEIDSAHDPLFLSSFTGRQSLEGGKGERGDSSEHLLVVFSFRVGVGVEVESVILNRVERHSVSRPT